LPFRGAQKKGGRKGGRRGRKGGIESAGAPDASISTTPKEGGKKKKKKKKEESRGPRPSLPLQGFDGFAGVQLGKGKERRKERGKERKTARGYYLYATPGRGVPFSDRARKRGEKKEGKSGRRCASYPSSTLPSTERKKEGNRVPVRDRHENRPGFATENKTKGEEKKEKKKKKEGRKAGKTCRDDDLDYLTHLLRHSSWDFRVVPKGERGEGEEEEEGKKKRKRGKMSDSAFRVHTCTSPALWATLRKKKKGRKGGKEKKRKRGITTERTILSSSRRVSVMTKERGGGGKEGRQRLHPTVRGFRPRL